MTPLKTYKVTGDLTPDARGTYDDIGEWNGKRSYQLAGNGWFIWWDLSGVWRISELLGGAVVGWWERADPNIEGDYQPNEGCEGTATVTEI